MENQYARVVTRRGERSRAEILAQVFEVSDRHVARHRPIPQSGFALRPAVGRLRRRAAFRRGRHPNGRVAIVHRREVLRGVKKPHECAAFGVECPATPARRADGVGRGRVRRILRLPQDVGHRRIA